MNIAICDDDENDAAQIETLLQEHLRKNGFYGGVQTFGSGEALLGAFAANRFDVVFLDIYMKGLGGMKTAERLREIDPRFALVFVTASRDHAMESFSHRPSYYVTKPIDRGDIENAFIQCRDVFLKNARYIEVTSDRAKIKIPFNKILYVETFGRETVFHTADGGDIRTTAQLPLETLGNTLGGSFLHCHRSYIVNLYYVEEVRPEEFKLRGGSLIPLRRRGRGGLRAAYADFMSDRLFEVL